MPGRRVSFAAAWIAGAFAACLAGCALQPLPLADERLRYNELVKLTSEQQLLLNIVRLRYVDNPSSLAISSIAAQTELARSLGLLPFWGLVGGDASVQTAARVLPTAQVAQVDRPTVSLTPLDDAEFTRKLFTPMTIDGVLYLARTTWPIATVFRLWLENLNWVPNAETASGPVARRLPDYARFRAGVDALQALQDRGEVVFVAEERTERIGSPLAASLIRPQHLVAAAKEDLEYVADDGGATWSLVRRKNQPVLKIDPSARDSAEMRAFAEAFRIERGRDSLEMDIGRLEPFPGARGRSAIDRLDLETRSLLQVLYFLAKGVEVPPPHRAAGWVPPTADGRGGEFDWSRVLEGLFRVRVSAGPSAPANAHVAVRYRDHWYWLARDDADSLSTFGLVLAISRLELGGRAAAGGPVFTLPLNGR